MKNTWKKLLVGIFVLAMVFTGMSQLSLPGNEVHAEDSVVESTKYYVQSYTGEQVKAYKDAKTAPVPTPAEGKEQYNDWIFAGWFTNEDCTGVLGEDISVLSTYYAKFVPAEVLSVKAQVKEGTTKDTDKTDMRLVATVDSLRYKSVGFEVYYDNTTPIKIKTTSVFTRIEAAAGGVEYGFSPNIFDSQSEYFVTATLKNIANKNFAKTFYIRPYVETLDGTISYGVSRYARVEDSYLNIVNIPVRVVSDATTATTGNISVAYPTGYFTYADTYGIANTASYANGEVFDSITVDGTTAGTIAITGTSETAQKVNGEVAHLRLQVNDGVKLPKKNTFAVTSTDLTTGVVCAESVYNHFAIAASYSGTADTSWYDANETEFVITTPEELYGLALLVNAKKFTTQTVYLGSDIVVNAGTPEGADGVWGTGDDDWSTVAPTNKWTPIGTYNVAKFSGTFDGQGHTISGVYTSLTATGAGLFGEIADGAYVRNFKLTDSYFTSTKSGVAALCGWYAGGTIEGIYTDAYVKATADHAGGLVMGSNANATIRNCWFAGQVDATQYVGGISGFIPNTDITIESCLNTGKINGTSQVGGILGRVAAPVTVNDTLSTGTVTINTSTTSGAIVGWIGTVSGSVGSVTCNNAYSNSSKLYHTLQTTSNTITGAQTVADLNGVAAYNNTELDFENYWVLRQSATPVLKSWCESGALYVPKTDWTGDGTEKSPYIITTPEQLYGLAQSVNAGETYAGKYFKLGADIRINTGNATNWGTTAPKYTWIPIGTSTAITFNGHFNATGPVREIKGLYVNQTANHAGLFGAVKNGSVKNIKVTNSYVEGGSFVAAVAGFTNAATIDNTYTDATVVGASTAGTVQVAGIVGYQVKGTVKNSWFDGAVIGVNSSQYVGGVVGRTTDGDGAVIDNCLATGTVESGRTSGNAYVGGILGGTTRNTTVSNCLSALKSPITVKGATGCIGSVVGGSGTSGYTLTVKNCYAASGLASKADGTGGAGKYSGASTVLTAHTGGNAYLNTTLEFVRQEEALPENERHDGIWVAREGKAPGLKSFVAKEDRMELVNQNMYRADKSWYNTTDTEFTIDNAEEFVGFMNLVNAGTSFSGKTVQLGADIELNVGKASDWYAGKNEEKLYNLIPIGNAGKKFTGTFDGKGHSIKGVYADHPSAGQIGLFGQVADGSVVRDFRLTNSYFYSGKKDGAGAAAICGWYGGGTFDSIYTDAYVHGVGQHIAGMIAVANAGTTIKNCWFAGTMKAGNSFSGGIISYIAGTDITIESCLNSGTLTGTSEIGGIVGRTAVNTTVKDSLSVGTIKSTTGSLRKGAIVGWPHAGTLTCENVYGLGTDADLFVTVAGTATAGGSVAGTYAGVADLTGANGFLNTWLNFDRPELPTPTTGKWVAVADSTPVLKSFLGDAERVSLDGQNMYRVDTRWYDEEETEFTITTAEQLIGFANLVNGGKTFADKKVTLGADITINDWDAKDYNNAEVTSELYRWSGIGVYVGHTNFTKSFAGTFDGAEHTVKGLYTDKLVMESPTTSDLNSMNNWCASLFGRISDGSVVKNVKVKNSYFEGAYYVAGVVGDSYMGTIQNVYSDAIINAAGGNSGGIVGRLVDETIENAWFDGSVTNAGQFVGGIVGVASVSSATPSIENCLVTGSVISTKTSNHASLGGILGETQGNISIKNCLVDAKEISAKNQYSAGSVIGCVGANKTVTSSALYIINGSCSDLITSTVGAHKTNAAGTVTTAPVACVSLNNYKGYMNTNLDFDNTWVAMEESAPRLQIFAPEEGRFDATSWYTKAVADENGNAAGTEANPYIIDSLADLYGLTKRVKDGNTFENQYIKLTKSITANTVENDSTVAGWATEAPYYVWSPIGGNPNTFSGHFDGGMNTISGLYATGSYGTKNPTWYTGLFGYAIGATIENVRVEDSYFYAANYSGSAVGALSDGTVSGIHSNSVISGGDHAGGIVGNMSSSADSKCYIKSSWFDGEVTGKQFVGGIVDFSSGSGENYIQHCLNTGTVKATTQEAGGVVGRVAAVTFIEDCLSVGTVTSANADRGSIVGWTEGGSLTMTSVYGYSESGITNGATGISGGTKTGITSTGGTKVTDLKLLYDAEAYERLDAGYWAARVGNYPIPSVFATDADYAKAAVKDAFYLGDTTFEQDETGAYLISSAAELYGLASLSQNDSFEGKTFKLTDDITINHQTLDANTTEATSYEWLPIGSQSVPFKGTFNGNGHTISGLYKYFDNTYDKGRWTGLFDTTEGCVVENLNVENTYFTYVYNGVNKDPSRIGTIAGYGGGTFRNISSTASLINDGRGTGGIIGQSITDTTISNCWFGGEAVCETTFQSSYLGGLIGFATAGDVLIQHSHVSGDVLGGSYHVGGLVGNVQGAVQATITDSMFNGNFKASDDIQGDVFKHGQLVGTVVANSASATGGKAPSLTVSNCYGVNNFASYDVGALTSYTHTDETVYTPTVTGSGKVSVKEDRLIGYAGNTAGLDYSGYWVLTKSGTPMLKAFAKANDIYDGSQLTSLFKLDTFSKHLADAEEVGAGRYTIKITGSTKAVYDQYCEALDAGIFNPYNNDQSSDLNGEGVYNKVYTSAACGDAANDDWCINATYLATSDTNGTITITVTSAEVLSQHLKADSIVSYAAEDGYTTSGLTPTFHMIEQKYQQPAASYVIQLSNGHFIVIDGGIYSEAPYLMEYLESLVPDGKKPIIEAWVLSHAHMDHIDSFRGFVTNASKYQGKVYLEGIYFSEASDTVMSTVNSGEEDGHHHYTPYIHRIGSVFQTTKGQEPQIYRMYTGQRYTFDTVVMDVMLANEQFTMSDYTRASQVTNPSVFNETSTWTMFTINGKKLLTAGDSNYIGKEFVVEHYSEDYLTVDIFTALHHGENINREQPGGYTNDDFSNAITVKGAVLYAYPTDWYKETEKTTIKARIQRFMGLQVSKGMKGIAATYESGSTAGSNPEDYFYHGQGTVVLTFGDSITANVKAKNDWVNDYTN